MKASPAMRAFVATVVVFATITALSKPRYNYEGSFEGRLAAHTGDDGGLASQRFGLSLEQNATFSSHWSGVLGVSGWSEAVYAQRPDVYGADVTRNDSNDLRFRNVFLQYQGGPVFLRIGNQQVVWGESLGVSPGDLVNPRDLRDGSFGDPVDVRLQTPMVNGKLIFDDVTLQALYLPRPSFNLLPSPGNDFAYPYEENLPGVSLRITREPPLSWGSGGGEYGGRIGVLIGGWDVSAFGLSSYDRNPSYVFDTTASSASEFVVRERHERIRSLGGSLTNDFGGYLLRVEAVLSEDRVFPTLIGAALSSERRSNFVSAIGLDLPTWRGLNTSLQWARDVVLGEPVEGLLRTGDQSLILMRLSRTFFLHHEIEVLESFSVSDGGSRFWLSDIVPLSSQSEIRFGTEILSGPSRSDYGRRERASRAFIVFKTKFRH